MKQLILTEFCEVCKYNRKYAIRKLNGSPAEQKQTTNLRKRDKIYSHQALSIIESVWKTAGYPWSKRLKVILRDWLPKIKEQFAPQWTPELEQEILSISPRQIDRRLKSKKDKIKKHMYGRTKPGNLLRNQIPIRTDNCDIHKPGFEEIDTVSHSGNRADGDFAYTVNQTDIDSVWTESLAVLGKGETGVVNALNEMKQAVPFPTHAYDPDNGGEFINWHLVRYCAKHHISLTHSRPYKKDDQAHIEQKNWTHVRRLIGWDRFDTQKAVDAMNDLYRNELRLFMNLFMPSVKLIQCKRIGSKLIRKYDEPKTPLARLLASELANTQKIKDLVNLRNSLNPFQLSQTIDKKLTRIGKMANHKRVANSNFTINLSNNKTVKLTQIEKDTLTELSKYFPGLKVVTKTPNTNAKFTNPKVTF
ncbi:MAG: integrase [Elusimicrobiota bacterium]